MNQICGLLGPTSPLLVPFLGSATVSDRTIPQQIFGLRLTCFLRCLFSNLSIQIEKGFANLKDGFSFLTLQHTLLFSIIRN
jgi:hypothetical protein